MHKKYKKVLKHPIVVRKILMNLFSFHVSVIVLVNEDRLSNTTTTQKYDGKTHSLLKSLFPL